MEAVKLGTNDMNSGTAAARKPAHGRNPNPIFFKKLDEEDRHGKVLLSCKGLWVEEGSVGPAFVFSVGNLFEKSASGCVLSIIETTVDENFRGVTLNGCGINILGNATGVVHGTVASIEGTLDGVVTGVGIAVRGDVRGALLGGFLAWAMGNVAGTVSGVITEVDGCLRGFALGLVNKARSFSGMRIGAVNVVSEPPAKGVQVDVGLVNIALYADKLYERIVPLVAIRGPRKGT
ncbi:MAG: hypothetical protein Q7T16_04070 [Candidatus Burarchaeum sp.]|nr:hypothetical protein [Candidatus Burarchaeum sp.]MDO8339806.1 hypothetical protein [Candidatus Burarchaeum sp.]